MGNSGTVAGTVASHTVPARITGVDQVENRLIEAFSVLRRCGGDDREAFRRASRSGAPDYVHEFSDKVGLGAVPGRAAGARRLAGGDRPHERGAGLAAVAGAGSAHDCLGARRRRAWAGVLRRLDRRISRVQGWRIWQASLARIAAEIRQSSANRNR